MWPIQTILRVSVMAYIAIVCQLLMMYAPNDRGEGSASGAVDSVPSDDIADAAIFVRLTGDCGGGPELLGPQVSRLLISSR